MSEESKNYVGNELNCLKELKEAFNSFKQFLHLDAKYVYSKISLRGWFYHNTISGENYVISSYGIASYSEQGLKWCLNDEEQIKKFLNVNAQISLDYQTPVYEQEIKKNQIKKKLGL